MNKKKFHDFSKTFGTLFFSSTFLGLEITILKFHDFSRFFMTVRTLSKAALTGVSVSIAVVLKTLNWTFWTFKKKQTKKMDFFYELGLMGLFTYLL